MARAALPYVGGGGDFTTHHTISIPAAIYLKKHTLEAATGNSNPDSGTLNNNAEDATDAILYSSITNVANSGLMDQPYDYDLTAQSGTTADATALPSNAGACIGMTSGGIRLRKEQDTVVYASDQLRGNFDEDATSNLWAIDCSMQEMNLYNLALAWGRNVAAVGSSSIMLMKAGDQEFHSLSMVTKAPQANFASSVGAYRRAARVYSFFKVKAWANGEIPHTRDDVQSIPVTFMTYCDGNENWGVLFDSFHDYTGTSHPAEAIAPTEYNDTAS